MPFDPNDPQEAVTNTPAQGEPVQPKLSPLYLPQLMLRPRRNPPHNLSNLLLLQISPMMPPMVSNAPAASPHPSVQKASILRQAAEALAGGKRFTTAIDPATGATTRTEVPLSRADIGMAIAMEAISGALSGLSVTGPGATGRAAAAGAQTVMQQQQQAKQQQEQQSQQDFQNQTALLSRRAQIFEANSRALLNTSEAEARGADAIDKLVSINRQSGVLDVDPELLDNAGTPMTQAELMDAMKAGKVSPTDQIGPVAGRVEITNPDGSKRWEATHLVIKDPSTKVPLTQEDWDRYAAAGVPGYPAKTRIGQGIQVKLSMKQNANEIAASHYLADQRLTDLHNVLDGTPAAKQVPAAIDFTKPGVSGALQRFQKYVSHDATNSADPYAALQAMGAAKRGADGQLQPNPDAKYVNTIADAFGGWPVLEAAHDQLAANKKAAADYAVIDSDAKATAVLSAKPGRFSQNQVSAARNFMQISQQMGARKAAQDARAHAQATGADVQAMFRFGKNPLTGETLSLDNAAPSMLVDPNGNVIPQDLVSTYKPTAQERQTADTARQVLAIAQNLRQAVAANPNLAGPLAGHSKQGLAKAGLGSGQAQKYLDDLSFLSSAATKMHTGRFSDTILKKMDSLIKPGMNPDQFGGALDSINAVAQRYADEDKLTTVSDWKAQQTQRQPAQPQPRQLQIPAGAQIGRDAQGNVLGYKLNGKYVPLSGGSQ